MIIAGADNTASEQFNNIIGGADITPSEQSINLGGADKTALNILLIKLGLIILP